ncbi:MAG: hypothetical protein K0R54_4575 [Clostridiaceae bacterium]|nr:hypothetical protein [Clostridiaceae bacterium]
MNKIKTISIILITVIITLILVCSVFFSCFNKFGNYAERGEPDKGHLATDIVSAYNLNVFRVINTIVTNEDYGTFIIKNNGEFIYYPGEYNVLDFQENNVYSYQGYWYKPQWTNIRFTATQTRLRKSLFNLRLKDSEFFCNFEYVDSGTYSFNDNLMIRGFEFKVLDNELIKGNKEKLILDDSIIREFIMQK